MFTEEKENPYFDWKRAAQIHFDVIRLGDVRKHLRSVMHLMDARVRQQPAVSPVKSSFYWHLLI